MLVVYFYNTYLKENNLACFSTAILFLQLDVEVRVVQWDCKKRTIWHVTLKRVS